MHLVIYVVYFDPSGHGKKPQTACGGETQAVPGEKPSNKPYNNKDANSQARKQGYSELLQFMQRQCVFQKYLSHRPF